MLGGFGWDAGSFFAFVQEILGKTLLVLVVFCCLASVGAVLPMFFCLVVWFYLEKVFENGFSLSGFFFVLSVC